MSSLPTARHLAFPPGENCGLRFVHSHRKTSLMQRLSLLSCLLGGLLMAPAWAQTPPAAPAPVNAAPPAPRAGGAIHGTVKAGNIPLPGVSVVATNTLT